MEVNRDEIRANLERQLAELRSYGMSVREDQLPLVMELLEPWLKAVEAGTLAFCKEEELDREEVEKALRATGRLIGGIKVLSLTKLSEVIPHLPEGLYFNQELDNDPTICSYLDFSSTVQFFSPALIYELMNVLRGAFRLQKPSKDETTINPMCTLRVLPIVMGTLPLLQSSLEYSTLCWLTHQLQTLLLGKGEADTKFVSVIRLAHKAFPVIFDYRQNIFYILVA